MAARKPKRVILGCLRDGNFNCDILSESVRQLLLHRSPIKEVQRFSLRQVRDQQDSINSIASTAEFKSKSGGGSASSPALLKRENNNNIVNNNNNIHNNVVNHNIVNHNMSTPKVIRDAVDESTDEEPSPHLKRGVGDGRSAESLSEAKIIPSSTTSSQAEQTRASLQSDKDEKDKPLVKISKDGGETVVDEIEQKQQHPGVIPASDGQNKESTDPVDKKTMSAAKEDEERNLDLEVEEEDEEEVTLESLHTSPPGLDRLLMDRICNLVAGKGRPVIPPPVQQPATNGPTAAVPNPTPPVDRTKDNNNNNSNKNILPTRSTVLPSNIYR